MTLVLSKKSKCGIISDGVQVRPMRPDVHGPVDDANFSRSDRRHKESDSTIQDPPTWRAFDTGKSEFFFFSLRGDTILVVLGPL